jgi:rare lipoprotein A
MRLALKLLVVSSLLGLLAGCSTLTPGGKTAKRDNTSARTSTGGYYKDDGPGDNPPVDLAAIPDAVPKDEPLHRFANRPYSAMGRNFTPIEIDTEYRASGLASWYGRRYHGKPTASGVVYDMYAMTAAHPTLPIPSYARVTNPRNGRSVIVRINDRGPFHEDRVIDLSYTAAWKLDLLGGVSLVDVEKIGPGDRAVAPSTIAASLDLPSGLYLQIAALGSADAAETLMRTLRDSTPSLPTLRRIEGGGLHKVQAGPFEAASSVEQAMMDIERAIGVRAFRVIR